MEIQLKRNTNDALQREQPARRIGRIPPSMVLGRRRVTLVDHRAKFSYELMSGILPMNHENQPTTVAEIIARYRDGVRVFIDLDLEDEMDFADAHLQGAIFDGTWLSEASFRGCKLQHASFRRCNLKCTDFRGADLRNTVFCEAALECSEFAGAILDGAIFTGSTSYGYTLKDDDLPPQ